MPSILTTAHGRPPQPRLTACFGQVDVSRTSSLLWQEELGPRNPTTRVPAVASVDASDVVKVGALRHKDSLRPQISGAANPTNRVTASRREEDGRTDAKEGHRSSSDIGSTPWASPKSSTRNPATPSERRKPIFSMVGKIPCTTITKRETRTGRESWKLPRGARPSA